MKSFPIGLKQKQKDVLDVRKDFPIFQQQSHSRPLIYLDSAASSQKPRQVIEALSSFYAHDYANIHRGIYELSERATQQYEAAREKIKQFIHAAHSEEIVFVRGTTEGINLVAQSFGRNKWRPGDEIILSTMEHHANIVPWLMLKTQMGLIIKVVPMTDEGEMDIDAYAKLFSPRSRMVALTHVSNALGTINPIKNMVAIAHGHGVPVLVDGAQAVPHMPIDVIDLDCDFYVFSGHKLYGPTGTGVLYGKRALLNDMPPYQGGGGMISTVSFADVSYAQPPHRFEAGTPHIAGAIGLAAAVDYVQSIGHTAMVAHEQDVFDYLCPQLVAMPGLRLIGSARPKVGIVSFVFDKVHPHDVATALDQAGIAVRAGHHCTMPLMARFNVPATVRASLGIYNVRKDVDALVTALHATRRFFA